MESDESVPTQHSMHDESPYYISSSYKTEIWLNSDSILNFRCIYVLGNKVDECPCYAGLDEQLFYNEKYEMIPDTYTGKWVDFN